MMQLSWRKEAAQLAQDVEQGAGVDRSIALADYIAVFSGRFAHVAGSRDAWRVLNKIADSLLSDAERQDRLSPAPVTMASIAEDVAQRHGIKVSDLKGTSRFAHIVRARQEFMYLARSVKRADGTCRYSTIAVGKFLNRDHSTVIYGAAAHVVRAGIVAA